MDFFHKGMRMFLLAVMCGILMSFQMPSKTIKGSLKSVAGKILPQVAIMLKDSRGKVVSFGYSNEAGIYTIPVPDTMELNHPQLELNWMGYKPQVTRLLPGIYEYNILLEEAVFELKEVKVKNRPVIRSSGDTLRYDVNSFASKEDRSIGDAIRRLPGIDVDENGRISYNGKTISNLYIHGDDVMDGRYGLATKTIPRDMIKSVEVIDHFQPLKVLQNKVLTNDVAINLVLKDENILHLSGQAMLGAGLPQQYDAALNTMVFNKRFKMLNSLKTNNSGVDYQVDFIQFAQNDFLISMDNAKPRPLLSDGTVGGPDIPRKNYYFNRSGVVNLNDLYNTADSLQLRTNIQVFWDRNSMDYIGGTDYYLPSDTVRYQVGQQMLRKPVVFNVSLNAMKNKSRFYLNNKFNSDLSVSNNNSELNFNGNAFSQRLHTVTYDIANNFQLTPALRKGVVSIQCYLNLFNNPQNLYLSTGIDSAKLNMGRAYGAVEQATRIPSFMGNCSIYWLVAGNSLLKQTYQAVFITETQRLNSSITLTQKDGSTDVYKGDVGNNLLWNRNKLNVSARYSMQTKNWETELIVPVIWQEIKYEQADYFLLHKQQGLFVSPSFTMRKYIGQEDYLALKYVHNDMFGDITNLYRGLIMSNYQLVMANTADLQDRKKSALTVDYNFRKNIIMLFANLGVSYTTVAANTLQSSVLASDVQQTILLPYENTQTSMGLNAGISKYIFAWRSKVSLQASWKHGRMDQLMNGYLFPYINDVYTVRSSFTAKLPADMDLSYNALALWSNAHSSQTGLTASSMFNLDQDMTIGCHPVQKLYMTLRARYTQTQQRLINPRQYFFGDVNLRCKLNQWHADLELDVTNLFNMREYRMINITANQLNYSIYAIRGRMAIARLTFNL